MRNSFSPLATPLLKSVNKVPTSNPTNTETAAKTINSNKIRDQSKASIRLLSVNVNEIKSTERVTKFHQLIDSVKPDVTIGCESKLDDSILATETFPVNYNDYRKDSNTFGGGVFIGV